MATVEVCNVDQEGNVEVDEFGDPIIMTIDRAVLPVEFVNAGHRTLAIQPKAGFPGHSWLFPFTAPSTSLIATAAVPSGPSGSSVVSSDVGASTSAAEKIFWSHARTLLLIETYRTNKQLLSNPTIRKKEAWNVISNQMKDVDPTFKISGGECNKKFSNLEIRFREKVDKLGKTGRGGGKQWAYFELMQEVLGNSAAVVSVKRSVGKKSGGGESAPGGAICPPSDTSDEEELDTEAGRSVAKSKSSKRRRVDEPPKWFSEFVASHEASEDKWRCEMREHMKRQEDIMKDRVDVLREMKDIMKGWVQRKED